MSVVMYQYGKRAKRKSGSKVFFQFAFILGISFIVGALLLKDDLARNEVEKTTVPIVTEVAGKSEETKDINEPLFTMKLPKDWTQSNRVQSNMANYYEWRSSKHGGNERMLRLHIDTMPASYKVVRMLPITPNGNKLSLGNISGDCIDFALGVDGVQRAQGNHPVEAKWGGVSFMCDPITASQTIGTGSVDSGIATRMSGGSGEHTFFFYYEDHNVRPDDTILLNILNSFTVR